MSHFNFNWKKLVGDHQRTIAKSDARFKVAGCGRRFGKSYLATAILCL